MSFSRRYFLAFTAAAAVPAWAAEVPRPSPDFGINMPDGTKLPLKKYRGKVVVMTFISTT